ncbi:MAG: mechanosensitive ion channel [Verrucomicrobia bacterium]|nr:mechanosensitive ion channel [Verrucomicrobiota bacterium]MBV9297364.1 mechanosensitive ion channel [Verrucomicrobiota bacterium]
MRNALSRLFWVLLLIPEVALSGGPTIGGEATPNLPYVPAHFPWVKTSWLQNLAERFSNYIDVLSLEFSSMLGGWSRQPLFFAITPAKLLLLLLILAIGFALAELARVVILKNYSLTGFKPTTGRFWRDGILFALHRALSGLFIFIGAFFASVPLLPHIGLALGGFPTFAIAAKVAQLGFFATGVGFCLRIVRLVEQWLNDFVNRSPGRWYYSAFPVLGQALFYNMVLFACSTAIYILDLPGAVQGAGFRMISIAGIITNTLLLIRSVLAVEAMMTSRSEMLQYDAYKKRRMETRVQMIRRLLVFIILVVGIAATLMNIEEVRQIGTGLLASAGVAGVIAGFAAQKSLSTIIAGLQIAITQPMRIDDVVIVEGEWGIIEEITLTYVVIRVWDQRRLVVPITNFLEKAFQNWTRNSSDLIGVVFLYADFLIPVEEVRAEAQRVVHASKLWDKRVFVVQVTDFRSDCVEIRILASADNSPTLFDLRCEIREKILIFLQNRYPSTFPRVRTALTRLADKDSIR